MNVLLLQLDGKLPNIALMRIAAHHRECGDEVEFRHAGNVAAVEPHFGDNHDRVYASAIFTRTMPVIERLREIRPDAVIGGTALDKTDVFGNIVSDITKIEQFGITTAAKDYSIYPTYRNSIGFTQRGCRLNCKFCGVPSKEGKVSAAETIEQIWRGDPWPKHLHLLDNDFFGLPTWRENIAAIRDGGFKVCFNQGVNTRFIGDEEAEAAASVRYYDDSFTTRRFYTAWDNRKDEERLFAGLDALVRYGMKPDHIMVYMLIGYWRGETHEDREHRRKRLREFGARPYPMPYIRTPELVGYQRWILYAYDIDHPNRKVIKWADWVAANYKPENLGFKNDAQLRIVA
jgi:hypothetical protein